MNTTLQISKHLREVFFGGNWTWSNLKDVLSGITLEQANAKIYSFNSIAALVYHINYFVIAISRVLEGKPLDSKDKYSFDHPPLLVEQDWVNLVEKSWKDVEHLASLIENLPDSKLSEIFAHEKYGNYYRNLHGVIEHSHYHIGQIVMIKKLLNQAEKQ